MRRSDVDGIDALVGYGADVTRPDIADHAEFRLPSTCGHEFARPADSPLVLSAPACR